MTTVHETDTGQAPDVDPLDVGQLKAQFPLLAREVKGRPIVYLDSANSTQKPRAVIEAMSTFMATSYAPVNRSSYRLAVEANDFYEGARRKVARFINAASEREVVFTKNATESLNLVAQAWGRANLQAGDAVVLMVGDPACAWPWGGGSGGGSGDTSGLAGGTRAA